MDLGFSNPSPISQFHVKIQSKSNKLTRSKSKSCLNAKFYQAPSDQGKIAPAAKK